MPMPKRAACLIIGRHPQVPREVRVICKQLTGILQLGDCCSHLNVKTQDSKILTPPEFEAAAGCSKGKNWKVSFGAAAACQWSCIMQPSPPAPHSCCGSFASVLSSRSPSCPSPFTFPSDTSPTPICSQLPPSDAHPTLCCPAPP